MWRHKGGGDSEQKGFQEVGTLSALFQPGQSTTPGHSGVPIGAALIKGLDPTKATPKLLEVFLHHITYSCSWRPCLENHQTSSPPEEMIKQPTPAQLGASWTWEDPATDERRLGAQ